MAEQRTRAGAPVSAEEETVAAHHDPDAPERAVDERAQAREYLAAREREEAQVRALMDGPPPPSVRNTNLDSHIGEAPQRPYAALEDRLGQFTQGYATYDQLKRALPDDQEVHEQPDGTLCRVLWVNTGERVMHGGRLHYEQRRQVRQVSLTQQGAKIASTHGVPTDYWNGWTWMRNGTKPEKDLNVIAQQQGSGDDGVRFAEAPPMDQALARSGALRELAVQDAIPEASEAQREHIQRSRARDRKE